MPRKKRGTQQAGSLVQSVRKDMQRQNVPESEIAAVVGMTETLGKRPTFRVRGGHVLALDLKQSWNPAVSTHVAKLGHLQELGLSFNRLEELPANLCNFKELRSFNLKSNKLAELPKYFGNLRELVTLNLADNQLQGLPQSFGSLGKLQQLDLELNQLAALPGTVGSLRALQSLNIARNPLRKLPGSLCSLKSLANLKIPFSHLSAIPECLGRHESLESLGLISEGEYHRSGRKRLALAEQVAYFNDGIRQFLPRLLEKIGKGHRLDVVDMNIPLLTQHQDEILAKCSTLDTDTAKRMKFILEKKLDEWPLDDVYYAAMG